MIKALFFVVLALNFYSGSALASADYPTKPIRLVVAFAPGSAADITARIVASRMSELLAGTVIVENKPGAGGNIGTELVAKSEPDGYTLLIATSSQIVFNPVLYKNFSIDVEKSIVPVALLTKVPLILVSSPALPFKTFEGFVDFAKNNSGKLSYGSPGLGTSTSLISEYLKKLAQFQMLHVPYRGQAPALSDLLAGNISVLWTLQLRRAST